MSVVVVARSESAEPVIIIEYIIVGVHIVVELLWTHTDDARTARSYDVRRKSHGESKVR